MTSSVHIPSFIELIDAPELAVLASLHASLLASEHALLGAHPTLADLQPYDPPTVAAARHLLASLRQLDARIDAYQHALRDSLTPAKHDDLPF